MQPEVTSIDSEKAVSLGMPAAELAPLPTFEAGVASQVGDIFIVHVRFRNDATVWLIDECPDHLDNQAWYNLLCKRAGSRYAPRMGGRGDFRLTRDELEALKARSVN